MQDGKRQAVKLEAWMSKQYAPRLRDIRRDFGAMGGTIVNLWVYPAKNPSRTAAIGRCVPVYIAQHILRESLNYFGAADSLVHQGFVGPYWTALGTSLFAESSLQRISESQFHRLLDDRLDTESFHKLYRQFSRQDKTQRAFGLDVPNPKYLHGQNAD